MDERPDEPKRPRHPKVSKEERAAELGARLRDNLRRRKDQARARAAGTADPPERPRRG